MQDEHFWGDVIALIEQAPCGGRSPIQNEAERETLLACARNRAAIAAASSWAVFDQVSAARPACTCDGLGWPHICPRCNPSPSFNDRQERARLEALERWPLKTPEGRGPLKPGDPVPPCACGTVEAWHNPGCKLYPEGGYPADQPWRGPPKLAPEPDRYDSAGNKRSPKP